MKQTNICLLAAVLLGYGTAVFAGNRDSEQTATSSTLTLAELSATWNKPANESASDGLKTQKASLESPAEQGQEAEAKAAPNPKKAQNTSIGEDAFAAFAMGNYPKAFRLAKAAAGKDDFLAQFVLGMAYKTGNGAPRNETSATTWFKKSLGLAQPAADVGDARAQLVLGKMYENAWVLPISIETCKWYKKSADQGYAPGQFQLAELYRSARFTCDEMYVGGGDKIAALYTEIYQKAAEQGYPPAELMLGKLRAVSAQFAYDQERKKDLLAESVRWHRKAAEHDYPYAQFCLAGIYESGEGVPKDTEAATTWYCKAAQNKLAEVYKDAVEKCPKQAQIAAAKKRLAQSHVDKTKRAAKFASYAEAKSFFGGTLAGDDSWSFDGAQGGKFDRLVYVNPMHYRGKVIESLFLVQQVVSENTLLLKPPIYDEDTVKVYYAVINENFTGTKAFDDKHPYAVIGEVVGTSQYTDVRGFVRTVPKIFIYAIAPYPVKG